MEMVRCDWIQTHLSAGGARGIVRQIRCGCERKTLKIVLDFSPEQRQG